MPLWRDPGDRTPANRAGKGATPEDAGNEVHLRWRRSTVSGVLRRTSASHCPPSTRRMRTRAPTAMRAKGSPGSEEGWCGEPVQPQVQASIAPGVKAATNRTAPLRSAWPGGRSTADVPGVAASPGSARSATSSGTGSSGFRSCLRCRSSAEGSRRRRRRRCSRGRCNRRGSAGWS